MPSNCCKLIAKRCLRNLIGNSILNDKFGLQLKLAQAAKARTSIMIYISEGTLAMLALEENFRCGLRNETSTLANIYSDTFVNTFWSGNRKGIEMLVGEGQTINFRSCFSSICSDN